ncbi:di-trans,poly-cis-decaprenylcistransferase [Candidatus Micrarchaeota archaeon]|nr:di-trans,poly-cis-decaprenylcistransferase [Candidatus Micrarchaeota archaeon]MBU2476510.1 di-trans,poly-cis-decaprenylcistransferase [Candidatus Micrarchaeota archaeon]
MLNSIAFIPDGNRRYASKIGIPLVQSYHLGTQKAWEVIDWLKDYPKITTGTFYTLSLENLTRSKYELKILFSIFERELDKVIKSEFFSVNNMKLKFIGRIENFPQKIKEKIIKAEEFTENNKKRTVNLALGYNGQAEIVDAAKKIALEHEKGFDLNSLDENSFKKFLYSDFSEPDLIIRTSKTQRLSGFLTYQSSYSELYFSDKFWPEFSKEELAKAINEYDDRQRRFGK